MVQKHSPLPPNEGSCGTWRIFLVSSEEQSLGFMAIILVTTFPHHIEHKQARRTFSFIALCRSTSIGKEKLVPKIWIFFFGKRLNRQTPRTADGILDEWESRDMQHKLKDLVRRLSMTFNLDSARWYLTGVR